MADLLAGHTAALSSHRGYVEAIYALRKWNAEPESDDDWVDRRHWKAGPLAVASHWLARQGFLAAGVPGT